MFNDLWQRTDVPWQARFIHGNSLVLGYAAWNGYLQQGRGLLVCDAIDQILPPINWSTIAFTPLFIATYLNYDLLNFEKHGFDAKSSVTGHYLEIKQCSASSETWGGTWNDTNQEKALAFSDSRLFTVVALWKGASDLQFMVYGQNR